MRHVTALAALLLATGCRPSFELLDEACHDNVPGYTDDARATDFTWRANCYRRMGRMSRGNVDRRVQEAAQAHADYLGETFDPEEVTDTTNLFTEEIGTPAYTGADVFERLDSAGYDISDVTSTFVWQYTLLQEEWDEATFVDYMMGFPVYRQLLLQPGWRGGGFGRNEEGFVEVLVVSRFPSDAHAARPVLYPADGQLEVPVATPWAVSDGFDVWVEWVGYPITVTVGGDDARNPWAQNPYGLTVQNAWLKGPDGALEIEIVLPGTAPYDLHSTVALLPYEPFATNTEYTASFEISWDGNETKEFTTTFRTGDGETAPVWYEYEGRARTGAAALPMPRMVRPE